MSKSKIAFFIIDYSLGGGVERVNSDLAFLFQENDIEVSHILSYQKALEIPRMNYPEDCKIKVLSGNKKSLRTELVDYLQQEKIERLLFQADNMTISLELLKAAQEVGCKAFAHYHGSPFAYLRKYPDAQNANIQKILFSKLVYPFKKAKLKKFLTQAKDGVICVSDNVRLELMNLFPQNRFRLLTIHNPSDLFFAEVENPRKNWISLVSRLERKHKNAFLSVKAWALIALKYPHWQLHIFGDGSLMQEMKSYVDTHLFSESVVFHGFEKEVKSELRKGKISISTSNCEGFSMAVMEAIEAGNAIVATKSDGGVQDMVIDEITGFSVAKNDAEEMARAIEKLINYENLRMQFAKSAQGNLKKLYEKDRVGLWKNLLFRE